MTEFKIDENQIPFDPYDWSMVYHGNLSREETESMFLNRRNYIFILKFLKIFLIYRNISIKSCWKTARLALFSYEILVAVTIAMF